MRPSRILSWSSYSNPVVLEALGGVEVEDEEHVGPVKHNDLVLFVLGADKSLEDKRREEHTQFVMKSHALSVDLK